MRIQFLTKYENLGASSRYRTLQYIPYLKQRGVHCCVSSLFSDKYLQIMYENDKTSVVEVVRGYSKRLRALLNRRKYDILVIEKELLPYLPIIDGFLLRNTNYVLDFDDAIFHHYDLNKNIVIRSLLKNKIKKLIQKAKLVISGNP